MSRTEGLNGVPSLSAQQLRVLACRERGLTYKATADELGIRVATVKFHLAAVFAKLRVHSSAEAVHQLREKEEVRRQKV